MPSLSQGHLLIISLYSPQFRNSLFPGGLRGLNFTRWSAILFVGWLREPLPVAFFDAAHGSEQMVIRSCPQLLRLAVKNLHHQRIENAGLFQRCHIAMDAGERCVETVKKIVDEGFYALPGSFGALVKSVSAIGRLSTKVICGQGPSVLITRARPVFFCVTDFGEGCNEKEAKIEETNFVKWVIKIVRWESAARVARLGPCWDNFAARLRRWDIAREKMISNESYLATWWPTPRMNLSSSAGGPHSKMNLI